MSALVRVTDVTYLGDRVLRVTFTDGLIREIDFEGVLVGIFAELDNPDAFAGANVDTVAGTLSWPGGLDLDPDVLYGTADTTSALQPTVVREYRLEQTR